MANENGWGDGAVNNAIGWGQGANNAISWGKSHLDSWSGATDIDGGNAPINTVAPALSGTVQEGQILTCSTGTWSGSPTYAYQWKRNGNNIDGATNSTYTLVTADVGQSIKCTVTATNFSGSANADSNTVVPVSAFSFLLDTYSGAAVAYSLRKLRSAYTGNSIRVRRSIDNAEQDIAFSNNDLDTQTMLDFVGYNMWTYSEEFNNALYVKTNINGTGTPAYIDVETAPDGTLTGDKIIENTTSGSHSFRRETGTIINGASYNISVYLKQAERTSVEIASQISGTLQTCILDLTNGNVSSNGFASTPVVTAEANGWYRFSVTITSGVTSQLTGLRVLLRNALNQTSYTGDGTSGVYVWGTQLSQTSSVKTYQKTVATAGGNGFVTTWYDQSTNANNSTQATAANQAQIVSSGALIVDVDTNKITTTWTSDSYSLTNSIAIAQGNYQIGVFRRQTTATRIISLASTASTPLIGVWGITDVISTNYGGGAINHQTNTGTGKYLLSVYRDTSNNVSAYLNNTALTGGTDSTTGQNITRLGISGASTSVGQKQELVYWNNDQSANRTGIETNVNTYWNAY